MKHSLLRTASATWLGFGALLLAKLSTVSCYNTTDGSLVRNTLTSGLKAISTSSALLTVDNGATKSTDLTKETPKEATSSFQSFLEKSGHIHYSRSIASTTSSLDISLNKSMRHTPGTRTTTATLTTTNKDATLIVNPIPRKISFVIDSTPIGLSRRNFSASTTSLNGSISTIATDDTRRLILKSKLNSTANTDTLRQTSALKLKPATSSSFQFNDFTRNTTIDFHRQSSISIKTTLPKISGKVRSYIDQTISGSQQSSRSAISVLDELLSTQTTTVKSNQTSPSEFPYTAAKSPGVRISGTVANQPQATGSTKSDNWHVTSHSKIYKALVSIDPSKALSLQTEYQYTANNMSKDLNPSRRKHNAPDLTSPFFVYPSESDHFSSRHILATSIATNHGKIYDVRPSRSQISVTPPIPMASVTEAAATRESSSVESSHDPRSSSISMIYSSKIFSISQVKSSLVELNTTKIKTKTTTLVTEVLRSSTSHKTVPHPNQSTRAITGTQQSLLSNTTSKVGVKTTFTNISRVQSTVESVSRMSLILSKNSFSSSGKRSEQTSHRSGSLPLLTNSSKSISKLTRVYAGDTKASQSLTILETLQTTALDATPSVDVSNHNSIPNTASLLKDSSSLGVILHKNNSVENMSPTFTVAPLSVFILSTSNRESEHQLERDGSITASTDSPVVTSKLTYFSLSLTAASSTQAFSKILKAVGGLNRTDERISFPLNATVKIPPRTKSANLVSLNVINSSTALQTFKISTSWKNSKPMAATLIFSLSRTPVKTSVFDNFTSRNSISQSMDTKIRTQWSTSTKNASLATFNLSTTMSAFKLTSNADVILQISGTAEIPHGDRSSSDITAQSLINFTATTRIDSQLSTNAKVSSALAMVHSTITSQNQASAMRTTPRLLNSIPTINITSPATIRNSSTQSNITRRLTIIHTGSSSRTHGPGVRQLCYTSSGERCVCYEATWVVEENKTATACGNLLTEPERRAVIAIKLETLIKSELENLENTTKDTIAYVVTNACNNDSYKCIPTSANILHSVIDRNVSLKSLRYHVSSLEKSTTVVDFVLKNLLTTVVTSENSVANTIIFNSSTFSVNSQNSHRIIPSRAIPALPVNPSVKFKKRRRRQVVTIQTPLLVRITAKDVIVVEMRPSVSNKPALLGFFVKYHIVGASGNNGTQLLPADTLKSILLNSITYLERKLNVSIEDIDAWANNLIPTKTTLTTATGFRPSTPTSSHAGSTPVVSWSTASLEDDSKTMIVAIAVGLACIVMLFVIIAIVITRMNSKWQGEFIPDHRQNGTISPDYNTHEMIVAAVDPAPRITDVPYKSPKAKNTSQVQLKRPDVMTSEI